MGYTGRMLNTDATSSVVEEQKSKGTKPGGCRPEAIVAAMCVLLLLPWIWVTRLELQSFWLIVLSVIIGVGIGCGISGMRRGEWNSRLFSGMCTLILLVVGVGYTVLVRLVPLYYPWP